VHGRRVEGCAEANRRHPVSGGGFRYRGPDHEAAPERAYGEDGHSRLQRPAAEQRASSSALGAGHPMVAPRGEAMQERRA